MNDCTKVGFPLNAAAHARAGDSVFVVVAGGGGTSHTGVKNGYAIFRATDSL